LFIKLLLLLLLLLLSKKGRSCYIKVAELQSYVGMPSVLPGEETETASHSMPFFFKHKISSYRLA